MLLTLGRDYQCLHEGCQDAATPATRLTGGTSVERSPLALDSGGALPARAGFWWSAPAGAGGAVPDRNVSSPLTTGKETKTCAPPLEAGDDLERAGVGVEPLRHGCAHATDVAEGE